MTSEHLVPKPLIKVKGKSLVWWSIQSFHELLTCGLITKKDIKIAVLKSQIRDYRSNEELKEYFGGIDPFIEISEVTSGPLETAFIAVKSMLESGKIDFSEQIVFSDSDHFAKSITLRRSLEKTEDLYLWEARKAPGLEWGFLNRSKSTLQIVEKPKTSEGLDTSKGIVGIYGFRNVAIFVEHSQEIIKSPNSSERFMSDVVNRMLRYGFNAEVNEILEFVPMGTPSQLASATKLPDPEFMVLDSPNFFVDIDGVLLRHNKSIHGQQTWAPDEPISFNIAEINESFKFARITLVTARPKSSLKELTKTLVEQAINYDEIIAGCTGGIRVLVNDRKPRLPFLDTAVSKNTWRNEPLNLRAINGSIADISGGSGAKTFFFTNPYPKVVKITKKPQEAKILSYQANWYEFCAKNTKAKTLKVIERYEGDRGVYGYATEYDNNLLSFETFKNESEFDEWSTVLIEGFTKLYEIKNDSEANADNLLAGIIKEKVLPSIEFTIANSSHNKLLVTELQELTLKFNLFMKTSALHSMDLQGVRSLIHGDPTFENLQVNKQSKELVFVDPVGKMIESGVLESEIHNHFSFPVFDLARLELSFRLNYENHIKVSRDEGIELNDCISIGFSSLERMSILDTEIAEVFSNYNTENLEIVLATTIARILKYKSNQKELLILTCQANHLMDTLL